MKIEWVLVICVSVVLFFVCYTDVRWRKITNCTSLLILILSLFLAFFRFGSISLTLPLILFFVGFLFSMMGVMGAGDVKLVCALSVGLSTTDIGDFLLLTGMFGIPLSLLTLLYYRTFSVRKVITVPYGVAICCGYWMLWGV